MASSWGSDSLRCSSQFRTFGSPSTNARQLRNVTADALSALVAANDPPELFVRFGLARVRTDETGRPIIEPATPAIVRHRLSRVSECIRSVRGFTMPVSPPREVVEEDLLALGEWPTCRRSKLSPTSRCCGRMGASLTYRAAMRALGSSTRRFCH